MLLKRLPGIGRTSMHQREVEANHSARTEKWASEFRDYCAGFPKRLTRCSTEQLRQLQARRHYYQNDFQAIRDPLELRLVRAWPNAPPDTESTGELGAEAKQRERKASASSMRTKASQRN